MTRAMPGAITIRFATADDCALLLRLIRGLAAFEKAPDAVVATEADLPVIVDIYNQSIPAGWSTADTEPISVADRVRRPGLVFAVPSPVPTRATPPHPR